MDSHPVHSTGDDYTDWVNQQIGAKVKQCREALGLTAYAVAKDTAVSDQTVSNIEQGNCERGCLTGTLARIAFWYGIKSRDLMPDE